LSTNDRVVITGMSINTPLGDALDGFLSSLLAGRSAITRWKAIDSSQIYSKVGGDLSDYDVAAKMEILRASTPAEIHKRLRKLISKSPWSTKLTMLMAVDAWLDAGFAQAPPPAESTAVVVGGHNLNQRHQHTQRLQFAEEPDYMDALLALNGLDTDHAGCVSEVLQARGPIYTVGAACASGNTGLRCAVDEVLHHGVEAALAIGPILDFSMLELHAMALMGAITFQSFNHCPEKASRPYDVRREGFVPAHGGGVLVIEPLKRALGRGARIYAEIVGVEANSDGNHLPEPSEEGQSRLMQRLLNICGLEASQIDFVSAHATSTPLGDLTEIRSIKRVFGDHAKGLKINAPKSLLGHTCWAAPIVETVAAVLQMRAGTLHPSINIDTLDPEVDLDVCRAGPTCCDVRYFMKNSFGFGGINCVSILRKWDEKAWGDRPVVRRPRSGVPK
jgi:3-oxoacyl-(acyl-carrier-protein) synthase